MLSVCSNLDFTITSAVLVKPVVRLFAGDCLEETSVVPTEQDLIQYLPVKPPTPNLRGYTQVVRDAIYSYIFEVLYR